MAIESDIYVRWGQDPDDQVAESKFDGDTTDWSHWYWSEARSCGFTVQRENQGADAGKKKGGRKKPYEVTMTKKVDYASPYLFQMCCIAKAKPPLKVDFPPQVLDEVRVEVCRHYSGGKDLTKVAFVVIIYENVRIKKYQISMNGPEATETLTLEFDSFRYGFRPSSPFTGSPKAGPTMKNRVVDGRDNGLQWGYSDPSQSSSGNGAGSASSGDDSSGSGDSDKEFEDDAGAAPDAGAAKAAQGAGIIAASSAAGGADRRNGSLHGIVSGHDVTTQTTFPGLWDDNGFGLLPD